MSDGFVLKVGKRVEPAQKHTKTTTTTTTTTKHGDSSVNADEGYAKTKWRQEQIWVEAVDRENKSLKDWNEKWSFVADYDQKGQLKIKEKTPDNVSVFSDKLPSSCGHTYGHRLDTGEAKQISMIQNAISRTFKKRRNNDLICYD